MSLHSVTAHGLRFAYLEWGRGPLVLALHGFPDTPHTWDVIGPALAAKGFRVVAPFTRGYAPTAMPASDTTTRELPRAEARFAKADFAQVEMFIRRWSPTWRFTAEDLAPIKACFREPGSVHGALGYYRASSVRTPAFMKERVRVPTLCFAGADDPGVQPATFEATRSHFTKDFAVAVIPGGHFCHRESPDQLVARVGDFLAAARP